MAREWLGLDAFSWVAIIAGCALMAWSLFLDWRLEHWAPGVYHHHSGGALLFAAMFWIGGLLRHPGSQAMTPTDTTLRGGAEKPMTLLKDVPLFLGIATAVQASDGDELVTSATEYVGVDYDYQRVRARVQDRTIRGRRPLIALSVTNDERIGVPVELAIDPMTWWWAVYDQATGGNLLFVIPARNTEWVAEERNNAWVETPVCYIEAGGLKASIHTGDDDETDDDDDDGTDEVDDQAQRERQTWAQRLTQLPTRADIDEGKRIWPTDWQEKRTFFDGQVAALVDLVEQMRAREAALVAETREAALTEVQEFVVAHAFDTTVGRKIDDFITALLNAPKE